MGLPLPTFNQTNDELATLVSEAQELIKQKDALERDLKDLGEELNFHGVGMDQPLIDASGFPRSDVDVAAVRVSRNQMYRLRNDYGTVMLQIEEVLHAIHDAKRQQDALNASTASTETPPKVTLANTTEDNTSQSGTTTTLIPFAVVNAVAPDSPAYSAGLRRGDKIIEFGSVNAENHARLQALNELVQQSLGVSIAVVVLREQDQLNLTLVPRQGWGGRGTLGCHIVPV
ncbi:hypothetical protein J3Q64DRAFT_1760591 [Phycomyces blakesleeanus]|uniref:PDZ domain-containing protein n=2 Tax=Phycomyces blakesleeanus TaxID=4837 RepID=A0ABR3AS82_PHYBL|nr:hypothetical protein PHYBLDRAFT_116771 [Phycomyces blakesleeanus NRRL 1555(-)]OAD68862.1 hypothetical protein PHYBLDRAFT_116771 [Phycomyces blakesleeanus NRRL 1555(-)]|eukprot:XP_018286902.1 hypothetical protein PHYBLDRAFT_116771 [Phycomyces blakesleeanus NRRL 1555(-)]